MSKKIGLGLVTCNRENFFNKALASIPVPDELIVINDGKPYGHKCKVDGTFIQHKKNKGVGYSKNEALRYLLDKGCDYIFLMEDDIIIKSVNIYEQYIKASDVTGLKHMNFAYHGPYNKSELGDPNPRKIISYSSEVNIALHAHLAGAFSFYTRDLLLEIGLMDRFYINAYEHLDHTLKIINKGYNPPFRWFPDIAESYQYITDQDPFLQNSIIRKNRFLFRFRYRYYRIYFWKRWGVSVENIPDTDEYKVISIMNQIKEKYSLR